MSRPRYALFVKYNTILHLFESFVGENNVLLGQDGVAIHCPESESVCLQIQPCCMRGKMLQRVGKIQPLCSAFREIAKQISLVVLETDILLEPPCIPFARSHHSTIISSYGLAQS